MTATLPGTGPRRPLRSSSAGACQGYGRTCAPGKQLYHTAMFNWSPYMVRDAILLYIDRVVYSKFGNAVQSSDIYIIERQKLFFN